MQVSRQVGQLRLPSLNQFYMSINDSYVGNVKKPLHFKTRASVL